MKNQYSILCVDDEPHILKSLRRLLADAGYQVFSAAGAREGLEIIEKQEIDLVISDQRMPVMNGSEFLRRVKQLNPNIIRIILSGYSDFKSLVDAVNEGEIFRFISKPWNNNELKQILANALEQNRMASIIENVVKDACKIVKIAEDIKIDISENQKCIRLNCHNKTNFLSQDSLFKFIELIYSSLNFNNQEQLKKTSGVITRKEQSIIITFEISSGLFLKILFDNV